MKNMKGFLESFSKITLALCLGAQAIQAMDSAPKNSNGGLKRKIEELQNDELQNNDERGKKRARNNDESDRSSSSDSDSSDDDSEYDEEYKKTVLELCEDDESLSDSELIKYINLQTLFIWDGKKVSNEGIRKLKTLKCLHLGYDTEITPTDVSHLKGLKELTIENARTESEATDSWYAKENIAIDELPNLKNLMVHTSNKNLIECILRKLDPTIPNDLPSNKIKKLKISWFDSTEDHDSMLQTGFFIMDTLFLWAQKKVLENNKEFQSIKEQYEQDFLLPNKNQCLTFNTICSTQHSVQLGNEVGVYNRNKKIYNVHHKCSSSSHRLEKVDQYPNSLIPLICPDNIETECANIIYDLFDAINHCLQVLNLDLKIIPSFIIDANLYGFSDDDSAEDL